MTPARQPAEAIVRARELAMLIVPVNADDADRITNIIAAALDAWAEQARKECENQIAHWQNYVGEREARADERRRTVEACEELVARIAERERETERLRQDWQTWLDAPQDVVRHLRCRVAELEAALASKIGPDWREALPYETAIELAHRVRELEAAGREAAGFLQARGDFTVAARLLKRVER